MKKRSLREDVAKVVLWSVLIFVVAATVVMGIVPSGELRSIDDRRSQVVSSQGHVVDAERAVIATRLDRLTGDLGFAADELSFHDAFANGFDAIEDEWTLFADHQGIYDHLSYIDLEGNEVVRIDYSVEGAVSASDGDLRNRADCDYFLNSVNLDEGQMFISRLELDEEDGVVQEPTKPIMRLCAPCFDSKGNRQGVVCLTYLAQNMLSQVARLAAATEGRVYVLNSDGYWLFNGYDSSTEWAFMYDDRLDESFANTYPEEWTWVSDPVETSGVEITENGLFTYANVVAGESYTLRNKTAQLVVDGGDWFVVSHMALDGGNAELFVWDIPEIAWYLTVRNAAMLFILFVLCVAFAGFLMYRKRRKDEFEYYSEYDEMTGVLNRRAGLEQLEKADQTNRRDGDGLCVCFVDVNALKEVNDVLGHESGDELIKTVVDAIKNNIRQGDFLVRMGGDEFLIVLSRADQEGAEQVWERIKGDIDAVNTTENRRYVVSASHGIAQKIPGESIDAVIHRADMLMYEEKRIMKKGVRFVRE